MVVAAERKFRCPEMCRLCSHLLNDSYRDRLSV